MVSYGSIEISSAIPSWKLRKADWPSFSSKAIKQLGCSHLDISLDEFSDKLLTIAKNNIPTRMWANAQRDGRPSEYRWCRLRKLRSSIPCSTLRSLADAHWSSPMQ